MIVSTSSTQAHRRAGTWKARTAYVAVVGVVAIAACGSSKPAYCSARTNLENSVKGLTSLNSSSGVNGLQSQVKKIQTDANTVVSEAKGDFPGRLRCHLFTTWQMGRYASLRNFKYLAYPLFLERMFRRAARQVQFDLILAQHAISAVAAGVNGALVNKFRSKAFASHSFGSFPSSLNKRIRPKSDSGPYFGRNPFCHAYH